MKIYTKAGDRGETHVFGGPRVRKDDPRIDAYGTVDELNAAIGCVRAHRPEPRIDAILERVQHELFAVGGELATPDPFEKGMDLVGESHVTRLEAEIDAWELELEPLRQFILPAGTPVAASLHLARTICRRAERKCVSMTYMAEKPVSPRIVKYLNRLSDLLFVLARAANRLAGVADVPWQKPERSSADAEE
ncbi:MAG: cob(I)yrinic acid a,c-diamide adenosyltransferase [Planctomycetota bacterium]